MGSLAGYGEEDVTRVVDDDPDDGTFLEAAVTGTDDYLVSGDRHLLIIDSFRRIEIADPRTFYERLDTE